jgi:hypothetical protein
MVSPRAFELDDSADRNDAGTSRYGAYLAHHQHLFRDDEAPTGDPAEFALMAWQVAASPIMTPSYVRAHPRVQGTAPHWDDERRAALAVQLALPTSAVATPLVWRGHGWTHDRYAARWLDPFDNSKATVLPTLTVRIPVPLEVLPDPRYRLGVPITETAKGALRVLCALMNAELSDVLADLDSAGARR